MIKTSISGSKYLVNNKGSLHDFRGHLLNCGDIVIYCSSYPVIGVITKIKQKTFELIDLRQESILGKNIKAISCKSPRQTINLTAMGLSKEQVTAYYNHLDIILSPQKGEIK